MKKRTTAFLVVTIIVMSVMMSPSAYAIEDKIHYYTYQNGDTVAYYLDENNNPYYYENGELIHLALPLEHLRVTDEFVISHLNSLLYQSDKLNGQRSVPTNYVDLSTGGSSTASKSYEKTIVFNSNSYITSDMLKYRASHSTIRVMTSNMVKTSTLANKRISFTYYYYSEYLDEWYYTYYNSVTCTSSTGFPFAQVLNTFQYGYFYFWNDGNLVSYDVEIWTTM